MPSGVYVRTEKHREIISIGRMGMKFSKDHKNNLSLARLRNPTRYWLGKKRSLEDIEKFRVSHLGKKQSLETRHRRSLAMIGKHAGNRNPMWNGGTARTMYGFGWNKTKKETIRNRFNRVCMMCFELENGRKLEVHHIDGMRHNHNIDNLVPLHKGCHSKTRGVDINRDYWKNYFQDIMKDLDLLGGDA